MMSFNKTLLMLVFTALFITNLSATRIVIDAASPDKFRVRNDDQVTEVIVKGNINAINISAIRWAFPNMELLDLSKTKILAYTVDNKVLNEENVFPGNAFVKHEKLKIILLPSGVTKIANSAFWKCTNLKKVVLPDSIRSIGQFTFQGCSSLTQMTFPESLTNVLGASFEGCMLLKQIYFKGKNPPSFPEWSPFSRSGNEQLVIYVPAKSVELYKNTRFLKDLQIISVKNNI